MASQANQRFGTTDPISDKLPTEADLALDRQLLDELRSQNTYESAEETEKRAVALGTLQKAAEEFVRHVGSVKGLAPSIVANAGGKIFTAGSYKIGVFGPGSDIDTLIAVPKHVTRDDFFNHFIECLEKVSPPGAIEKAVKVQEASVPIIKMDYQGIDLDLLFARLAVASVPPDLDLNDNSLMRGLEPEDVRSVNGNRVATELLALVPQTKVFRQVTRAVKLWAQRRAVYGNIVGYPGGIAWAMMVARVCQLYPYACGALVLWKFFMIMVTWPWPRPVLLKEIVDVPLHHKVWNPQIYHGDKRHLMPVITPAYPEQCSTHNMTHSNFAVVMRELQRGHKIAEGIFLGKKQWTELFQKHTFFTQDYKRYLAVIAASPDKDAQDNWGSLVESRVRRLVMAIEQSDADDIELAQPFNKGFKRVFRCKTDDDKELILRGDPACIKFLDKDAEPDGHLIYTKTFYIGLELKQGRKELDISYPCAEFKRQCTEWPQYNPDLHSIRINITRCYHLPDDCFSQAEVRPQREKKTKKRRADGPAGSEPPTSARRVNPSQ
ncbi:Poly(A) polymerase [Saccharata proteae CBS 121410]|uniref:Poly(A) polymerase n=1 Tax=Saccharata proteae CBS 121410 TaxID=1314787 RepID=A0A9P4HW77_9PEZI|nr:Poly(A) polymerase [Saccharata proteae CBS 121410]